MRILKMGLAMALGAVILAQGAAAQTPEQIKGLEEAQKQTAAQLKQKLPWKLDPYTTMTEVVAEGVMIIYTYTVDTDKITLSPNFLAIAKQASVKGTCKPENMENMRFGAAYRHRYLDARGLPKGSFDVTFADCG